MFKQDEKTNQIINKVLEAQKEKLNKLYKHNLEVMQDTHKTIIEKITNDHNMQIDAVHQYYRKNAKAISIKRIERYKKIINEKVDLINGLVKENKTLRKKLKSYKEAYEIYRPYRDIVMDIASAMGQTSEKITETSAQLNSFFYRLSDLAERYKTKVLKIDERVEEKMLLDELSENSRLKLIENDDSGADEKTVIQLQKG